MTLVKTKNWPTVVQSPNFSRLNFCKFSIVLNGKISCHCDLMYLTYLLHNDQLVLVHNLPINLDLNTREQAIKARF